MRERSRDAGFTLGWTLAPTSLGFFMVGLANFVAWELRAPAPILPMRLFRGVSFSAANTTGVFQSGAVFGGIFLMTQYFQLAGLKVGFSWLSFTIVAGLAVLGALAALGVGNTRAVAPASSSPERGSAAAS